MRGKPAKADIIKTIYSTTCRDVQKTEIRFGFDF